MSIKKYISFLLKSSLRKKIVVIVVAVLVVILAVIMWGSRQPKAQAPAAVEIESPGEFKQDIIYFYGQENPRSKNIEKFIKDNKIDSKISFAQKEVWHDGSNDMERRERVKECGLDPDKVGVPFVWARGECYIGEMEVEKFLKEEADIK